MAVHAFTVENNEEKRRAFIASASGHARSLGVPCVRVCEADDLAVVGTADGGIVRPDGLVMTGLFTPAPQGQSTTVPHERQT